MNKKPIQFLIFKIAGFLGIIVAVIAFVLIFTGFGDFESNNFMIGAFLLPFGFALAGFGLTMGFKPEIAKMSVKSAKFIQQENKEDLKDIAEDSADIVSGAITKTTEAVKDGLSDKKFCKHCGQRIDTDSKFCSECGEKQ